MKVEKKKKRERFEKIINITKNRNQNFKQIKSKNKINNTNGKK